MIKLSSLGPWAQLFEYPRLDILVAVQPLLDAIEAHQIPLTYTAIDPVQVTKMIERNIVLPEHVLELATTRLMKPIVLGIHETGEELILDGSHRYVLMGLRNMKRVPSYTVYPALWRQFEVDKTK
jgi:hypothetical protein